MRRSRLIYSRGFPYGAPLVMLRGGATKIPEVKASIQRAGFRWDGSTHAWATYLNRPEFVEVLVGLAREHNLRPELKAGSDDARLEAEVLNLTADTPEQIERLVAHA